MVDATTITKETLAKSLKSKTGLSGVLCEEIVSVMFKSIVKLIKRDSKLVLTHFGTFRLRHKKARPGFNLHTMEQVIITPRDVISFIAASSLKTKLNSEN